MVARVTFTRKASYRTKSNLIKKVRTPGGKLTVQYVKKRVSRPSCGGCDRFLNGLKSVRPLALGKLKKNERTVNRAYGGSQCYTCVRERIVRAFLIEEQKIVKNLSKAKKSKK